MNKFFFTFGPGHTFIGGSLGNYFVIIEADSEDEAKRIMNERRGARWCAVYHSAAEAGVEKYGLIQLPFVDLIDPVAYHVIFHRMDLDGIGSAMVVLKHLLENGIKAKEIKLHPYNYGEPTPNYQNGDHVFVVDLTLAYPAMQALHIGEQAGLIYVTWIDHHKSAYDDSVRYDYDGMDGLRTLHRPSAIELCWNHFFSCMHIPRGIQLLSMADTWCNEDKHIWENEILPFQFGMNQTNWLDRLEKASDSTTALEGLVNRFVSCCNDNLFDMIEKGETIMAYQKSMDERASKRAFSFRFHGVTFAALNHEGNSNTFRNIPFMHDARMLFRYDPVSYKWRFSMYGVNDKGEKPIYDLSTIAKELGGGGHKHACGFEVDNLKEVFGEGKIGYVEPDLF